MTSIAPILLPKPLFKFLVFQSDHNHPSDRSEGGQSISHGEPDTDTPGQHLAEVPQINRMPDAIADSRDYQALFSLPRQKFSRAAELRSAEVLSGTFVEPQSNQK